MGIETKVGVAIDGDVVLSVPEAEHAAALSREEITPAVHYLRFPFGDEQVEAFRTASEVALVSEHPAYPARSVLVPAVREQLLGDLLGTTKPLSLA